MKILLSICATASMLAGCASYGAAERPYRYNYVGYSGGVTYPVRDCSHLGPGYWYNPAVNLCYYGTPFSADRFVVRRDSYGRPPIDVGLGIDLRLGGRDRRHGGHDRDERFDDGYDGRFRDNYLENRDGRHRPGAAARQEQRYDNVRERAAHARARAESRRDSDRAARLERRDERYERQRERYERYRERNTDSGHRARRLEPRNSRAERRRSRLFLPVYLDLYI